MLRLVHFDHNKIEVFTKQSDACLLIFDANRLGKW